MLICFNWGLKWVMKKSILAENLNQPTQVLYILQCSLLSYAHEIPESTLLCI